MDKFTEAERYALNCTDNIQADVNETELKILVTRSLRIPADVNETELKILVTRSLRFDPEVMFELSVSFGAVLDFDEKRKSEYDWRNINMADEIKENGEFVLSNLFSRISLLIGQITGSFGQQPLILAPTLAPDEN
ncbi:hypothetical protein DW070_17395 [Coprococcus catus]|uniref:Uncharacterized protein n=1 Tax=Coprococcus catus TaxID=116085 RepID=A0A3E2TA64_9FIRM|nr:hypothetical protein DW070_17395 [Coprococcus catus]